VPEVPIPRGRSQHTACLCGWTDGTVGVGRVGGVGGVMHMWRGYGMVRVDTAGTAGSRYSRQVK
jgi:hypothetical protein